jgi:hypothetical protein
METPSIKSELQWCIFLECMFAAWLPMRFGGEYDPEYSQWLARHWFAREIEGRN